MKTMWQTSVRHAMLPCSGTLWYIHSTYVKLTRLDPPQIHASLRMWLSPLSITRVAVMLSALGLIIRYDPCYPNALAINTHIFTERFATSSLSPTIQYYVLHVLCRLRLAS